MSTSSPCRQSKQETCGDVLMLPGSNLRRVLSRSKIGPHFSEKRFLCILIREGLLCEKHNTHTTISGCPKTSKTNIFGLSRGNCILQIMLRVMNEKSQQCFNNSTPLSEKKRRKKLLFCLKHVEEKKRKVSHA